ncbi:hypothetical protein BKA62DRAFT_699234 [Auriculariales sp. MPI-PUGE-AT-0066]|nr:hypothetical protein BKA62DRAFT_699234 [Auriculariales sp. MPI-PUGE-AT-0066]
MNTLSSLVVPNDPLGEIEAQQLQRDKLILETLDAHLNEAEAAQLNAEAERDAAQRRLEVANVQHRLALQRRDGYVDIVKGFRHGVDLVAKVPRVDGSKLPEDVLVTLFMLLCTCESVCIPKGAQCTPISLFASARRAPWTLAAVCRRWRSLALSTTMLWSLVILDEFPVKAPRRSVVLVNYVATLLERSEHQALDIFISWPQFVDLNSNTTYLAIFCTLVTHISRWKIFEIEIGTSGSWFDLLRGITPLLERYVCNHTIMRNQSAVLLRYLPVAPRLREFAIRSCPYIPRGPYPSLDTLTISTSMPLSRDTIWSLLRDLPRVRTITIDVFSIDNRPVTMMQLPAVTLPMLTDLTLSRGAPGLLNDIVIETQFCTPALKQLHIDGQYLHNTARSAIEGLACKLVTLFIVNGTLGDATSASALLPLTRLEKLHLRSVAILDGFWQALMPSDGNSAVPLPSLTSLILDGVGVSPGGDAMLQFVIARRVRGVEQQLQSSQDIDGGAGPNRFTLEEVRLENVSPLLMAEMEHTMQAVLAPGT